MDGAALLLLVSGVGVAFGWQPMPDGTPRYEYVVQVEPELAATLADGKSIPIVSDIPPDVQPVGRIRVVVGREAPPRQRLITLLKPATAEAGGESSKIQLAQYDNPNVGQRYAAAPAQAAPPQTSWNDQQPDPSITPTGEAPPSPQQLFGQPGGASAWNADAATDALSRAGSEIQRSVDPIVRKGVERVDTEVREAADSLGDRTRNLVDEIRQPFRPQQPAAIPPAASASAASQAERSWNDPPAGTTSTAGNPLPSASADAGATWNDPPVAVQGATGQPGPNPVSANPNSATPGLTAPPFTAGQTGASQQQPGSYNWNGAGSANSPGAAAQGSTGQPKLDDPWADAPDPRGYAAVADSQGGARTDAATETRPMPFGGLGAAPSTIGPQFPGMGVPITGQQPAAGVTAVTAQPGLGAGAAQPPAAVGKGLLNQPADRPLDSVAGPAPTTSAPAMTSAAGSAVPAWPAATQRPGSSTATAAPTVPPSALNQPAPQAAASNAAAVLVAWVLLSGSIAGNFYLFWSYLDVRHKYRAVVRKTARAVGSRFSAA